MAKKETVGSTITVAFVVCLVCAIIVASAAVALKPTQKANEVLNLRKNVLIAADIYDSSKGINEQFEALEEVIIDFASGKVVAMDKAEITAYNQRKATKVPETSRKLPKSEDIASIFRQSTYAKVYVEREGNEIKTLVLPIHGYGLWSTMYGFVSLEADFNTVKGLVFYEHAETPGLGGEIENAKWLSQWPGKQVVDANGQLKLSVKKGGQAKAGSMHEIDGLAGATLTTQGVDNLVKFWMGDSGFAPLLKNLKNGEAI